MRLPSLMLLMPGKTTTWLIGWLTVLLVGCGTTYRYTGNTTVASNASNAFAVDVYEQIRTYRDGKNIVVSPASIHLALSMTAAGARGETAEEMWRVLHSHGDPMDLHRSAGPSSAHGTRIASKC